MTTAAQLLREAREQAGLTQSALAARAGTSQATLSAYESGARQPNLDTFLRLIAATDSRLAVMPGPTRRIAIPTRSQMRRVARTLPEVIGLAEALPHRHHRQLRYPPLKPLPGQA
jgi:transcriptional regulator with XRE-family HTH domain